MSEPIAHAATRAPLTKFHRLLLDRRWTVILMLAMLHGALTGGLSGFAERALLMSHFGCFLLWQPVIRADRPLSPIVMIALAVCGAALLFVSSGWLVALWLVGLIGIIGGRVFTGQMPGLRIFNQFALCYLLLILLFWVVPVLVVGAPVPWYLDYAVRFGLPLLLVIMAFLPLESEEVDAGRVVDFVYGLLFFLLVSVLILGTLAFMDYAGNYYLALSGTVLSVGVILLLLGMLWNPTAGFTGLQTFFSRYLLSLGLPFETWLKQLAEGAERFDDPDAFLQFATQQLSHLPWVVGGEWQSPNGSGTFGEAGIERTSFHSHDLKITLNTAIRLSPAITLHIRLLTQLLGTFFEAKRREQLLKQNAYIQAVHETGARLTHDIKNLLQSLFSLASAGENLPSDQMDAYAKLIQRQLPPLAKRLQLTLESLRAPKEQSVGMMLPAREWWEALQTRYEGRHVDFVMVGEEAISVPRNLYDSVAENLLENARRKRMTQPGVTITVTFDTLAHKTLTVCDTGAAIPEPVASKLFRQPVGSESGTGIGLLQAFRQADGAGFRLSLAANQDGKVCFYLAERG
jgi:signal transduction histidine kinase